MMLETFLPLLTGHLLGDFVFQTGWIAGNKRRIGVLVFHAFIVALCSFLLLGSFHWQILALVFLTHFVVDTAKSFLSTDALPSFLTDQGIHFAVLIVLGLVFPSTAERSWWTTILNGVQHSWYFAALSFVSGVILAVPAGGFLVGKATRPFMQEIGTSELEGLQRGGLYIGWLERALVLLFLLIGQPSGIGFLVAAKSILRFGEIKDAGQRKIAEYIIIGTFLSFGWAILISTLTHASIQYFLGT